MRFFILSLFGSPTLIFDSFQGVFCSFQLVDFVIQLLFLWLEKGSSITFI
jgi:hypothetical protein